MLCVCSESSNVKSEVMIGILAVNAIAVARYEMKGIIGVLSMINSITVPTVVNQNPMFGMAVNARSVELQNTHSAMTASASTVGRERL